MKRNKALPSLKKQAKNLKSYMNLNSISIILQVLTHIYGFSKYFTEGNFYRLNKGSRFKGKLANAFSQFISFMQMAQSSSYSEMTTVFELAEHFQPKFKKFYKRDPYEVLDFIIWGLHEECNRSALRKYRSLEDLRFDSSEAEEPPKNDSHVLDNFEGELYIEMKCYDCGWLQKGYEKFTSLSLPFPQTDEEEFTLDDCISEFLSCYQVKMKKNVFFCDRCWDQTTHIKTVYFHHLPKVLAIRIDRFGKDYPERRNNLSPINFTAKLDLYDETYKGRSKYELSSSQSYSTKYSINAVIEHMGLVSSNQFQLFFKNAGYWYKYFGHSRVERAAADNSDIGLQYENNTHAYMFFYEQQDMS
ncbi:unnamed protein product [Moneuplotes crassus]|uniref:USP domain-containing protein n=1 Tax=Euplotes crassus TaxID=5936 RepID=A0AAD1XGK1_EUPCR|nr:unnamed protein product [Moneuplotes crassus]